MADYIKRSDAMTICERYSQHCFETSDSRGQDIADRILDDIAEMNTADVEEVKHGYWELGAEVGILDDCICSLCGKTMTTMASERANYCHHCGAKMDGGKTE